MQLGWSALLKDTKPCPRWGSNPQPCDLEYVIFPTELLDEKNFLNQTISFKFDMYRYGSKYADTMANSEGPYETAPLV